MEWLPFDGIIALPRSSNGVGLLGWFRHEKGVVQLSTVRNLVDVFCQMHWPSDLQIFVLKMTSASDRNF